MTPWDLVTWLAVAVLGLGVVIIAIAVLRDLGSLPGPGPDTGGGAEPSRER